jgi:hypothetical protein
MDGFSSLFDALDMLDLVLAVFGALIVSLWFGRGKNIWGLLSGAFIGGFIKPAILFLLAGSAFVAVQDPSLTPTDKDSQKLIDLVTGKP